MNTQDWLLPMIFEIKTDTTMKNLNRTVKSGFKIEILNQLEAKKCPPIVYRGYFV